MDDIELLIEGFNQFRAEYQQDKHSDYNALVEGSNPPNILMIACCDSRVDPAIITNSKAGDLVVVRNIANIVPPYDENKQSYCETSAAIEFATCYQEVEHIIVMGHSRCGGIRSLLTRLIDQTETDLALHTWTNILKDVAEDTLRSMPGAELDDQECACSRAALAVSLKNLRSYPSVKRLLDRQLLDIRAWYFNLSQGKLEAYNPDTNQFFDLC